MRLALLAAALAALFFPIGARSDSAPPYRLSADEIRHVWTFTGAESDLLFEDTRARGSLFRVFAQIADRRTAPLYGRNTPLLVTMMHVVSEPLHSGRIDHADAGFYVWGGDDCRRGCGWFIAYAPTGDVAIGLPAPYDFDRTYSPSRHLLVFVMACADPTLKKRATDILAQVAGHRVLGRVGSPSIDPTPVVIETPCR